MNKHTRRVVLVIQARMGSVRLPGKTMMPLAGKPLLYRMVERLRRCQTLDCLVVATSDLPSDDIIAEFAAQEGIDLFRGSETDLVDRYYRAAVEFGADVVLRIPADNPTPEPAEVDRIVQYHLASDNAFSSNLAEVFGNGYPDGIGAEVMEMWALKKIWETAAEPDQREHAHLNFYNYDKGEAVSPDTFKVGTVPCPVEFRRPDIVLDVNTADQYRFLDDLYRSLYPKNSNFHITDIIAWYDKQLMTKKST